MWLWLWLGGAESSLAPEVLSLSALSGEAMSCDRDLDPKAAVRAFEFRPNELFRPPRRVEA